MKDDLGKRMKKQYESRTRTWLPRRTYTLIRLDGKAFHTFTRGMERPFDANFAEVMDETTRDLCNNIQGCKFAFTQSDEISLLLTDFDRIETAAWFDGNVQKIVSVSASMATAYFNHHFLPALSSFDSQKLAFFDSRTWTIPDPIEVENYFIWRQKDAMRNAISMHAQSLYSPKELHGKSQVDMLNMILDVKGEDHNEMPKGFQWGRSFVKGIPSFDGFSKMHYNFNRERINLSLNIPHYE